jgi:hypothetical protein
VEGAFSSGDTTGMLLAERLTGGGR